MNGNHMFDMRKYKTTHTLYISFNNRGRHWTVRFSISLQSYLSSRLKSYIFLKKYIFPLRCKHIVALDEILSNQKLKSKKIIFFSFYSCNKYEVI